MRLGLNHFRLQVVGQPRSGRTNFCEDLKKVLEGHVSDDHYWADENVCVEVCDGDIMQGFDARGHICVVVFRVHLMDENGALRWVKNASELYAGSCGLTYPACAKAALDVGMNGPSHRPFGEKRAALHGLTAAPASLRTLVANEGVPAAAIRQHQAILYFLSFMDCFGCACEDSVGSPSGSHRSPCDAIRKEFAKRRKAAECQILIGPLSFFERTSKHPWQNRKQLGDLTAVQQAVWSSQNADSLNRVRDAIRKLKQNGRLVTGWYAIYLSLLYNWVLSASAGVLLLLDEFWLQRRFGYGAVGGSFLLATAASLLFHVWRLRRQVIRSGWREYRLFVGARGTHARITPYQNCGTGKWGVVSKLFETAFQTFTLNVGDTPKNKTVALPDVYSLSKWCKRDDEYNPGVQNSEELSLIRPPEHRDPGRTRIELVMLALTVAGIAAFSLVAWWTTHRYW